MTINHLGANSRGSDMTESQDDKYLKHNDHVDLLADKTQRKVFLDIGFSSSNVFGLSAEDYTENAVLHFRSDASPSVDQDWILEVPATQSRFAVFNDTGFTCFVKCVGSPGKQVEVLDGGRADLHCDGQDIEELKRDIYDLSFFTNVWSFDAILGAHIFPRSVLFPAGLPGSEAYAWVPTSASENDRVISIQKNEVEVGTVTFGALANAGTLSLASDTQFDPGDRIRLLNGSEGSPDDPNTLADVCVALKGIAL